MFFIIVNETSFKYHKCHGCDIMAEYILHNLFPTFGDGLINVPIDFKKIAENCAYEYLPVYKRNTSSANILW